MIGEKPDEDIRRPFQWTDDPYAGFTTGFPWRSPYSNYKDYNVKTLSEDPESILNTYKSLIQTRNRHSALRTGDFKLLDDLSNSVLAYERSNSDESILVLTNLSSSTELISELDISSLDYNSENTFLKDLLTGEDFSSYISSDGESLLNMNLDPYRCYILTYTKKNKPELITSAIKIYPNPSQGLLTISLSNGAFEQLNYKVSIINSQGRKILEMEKSLSSNSNTIDVSGLRNGYYFLVLETSSQKIIERFIKN
jgi:hypothetical protein